RRHAPVRVASVCASGTWPVYNLRVGGTPEYFANGVLVHNCDALNYALGMAIPLRGANVAPVGLGKASAWR
ncbi:MAG: hypothetical protein ACRD1G_19170, partial [Acidimicrobiales bacterium]